LLEGGNNRYALHVDVFNRDTGDVKVPTDLACSKGGANTITNRICNSDSKVRGGAAGGSVFFDHGYLGASVSTYRSNYGTVAEDDVTIDMKSNRIALEGEVRNLGGFIRSVKGQLSHTDYRAHRVRRAQPRDGLQKQGQRLPAWKLAMRASATWTV
jgi:iron complex outermembrane receptor protein